MKATVSKVAVLLLLILSVATYTYAANTLIVTKTADTTDGFCNSDCSLREAVTAAASGDAITFSSLFFSPQTIALTEGQIEISRDLTITGPGINYLTVSGNNASRIFKISGGVTVSISRMKLRDGNVGAVDPLDAYGGAIYVSGRLTLSDVECSNNIAFHSSFPNGRGGAIYGEKNSTITLSNVNMHHNTSRFGAVHAEPGTVNVTNSLVSGNTGSGIFAGILNMENSNAIANTEIGAAANIITLINSRFIGNGRGVSGGDSTSQMVIENCLITDNLPDGGIGTNGIAHISNTIISNNFRVGQGGGIGNVGTLYVTNSSITGNQAIQGGGGIRSSGHLFLTNTTVSGNVAGAGGDPGMTGGGIYSLVNSANPSGRFTLTNSTLTNNSSTGLGGGLRHDLTNEAKIRNTIIAGNVSTSTAQEDVSGIFISEGTNLIGNSAGSSGWLASDLLDQNPLLAPLGNNGNNTFTHALLPGSPAINAGNNALAVDPYTMLALTVDQRGVGRFIGGGTPGIVDIGAYEAFYSSTPVTVSGLVTTSTGRGLDRVRIKLDDGMGNVSYTQTNPFGYYRFVDLIPGKTYLFTVTHKFFMFDSPQSFTADQSRDDLNLIGTF